MSDLTPGLLHRLLAALFPPRCAGCGLRGVDLCGDCRARISWLGPEVCPWCAVPTRLGRICRDCARQRPHFDGVCAASAFEGAVRTAVHDLKYRRVRSRAALLADLMLTVLEDRPLAVDVLVPVPLASDRRRTRGFNQSELIADVLGQKLGVPVAAGALERVRETPRQVGRSAVEREANVAGAFACRSTELVLRRRVGIVDDVMTTGATLAACTEALRMAGARQVYGMVVAREL
ncbi:MAG: ComF family protein [Chloroflexi bacterium]|nr:ComF family protein [Chloroflexota bacterium]